MIKKQNFCEEYVKPQYYNPVTGLQGGIIKTKEVCVVCYDENELAQSIEIERSS